MKKFFNFILNQVIIQMVLYVIVLLLVFFFVPTNLPINMLEWPIEGKFIYAVFSFIALTINWISVYDNLEQKDIVCSCPYCEKTFKVDLTEKSSEKDSEDNTLPIFTGIAIGTMLASS